MKFTVTQFYDYLNILKCLTLTRIINASRLYISFLILKHFKLILFTKGPLAVSVESTTYCNLECPQCPSGTGKLSRKPGNIDTVLFKKWLAQLKDSVIWLNLYFQGEPFLNRNFFHLIKTAKKQSFYVVSSTNGHFLNYENCQKIIDSGLDRLIVSLDGTDQKTYGQYRVGGSFKTVVNGIETLLKVKRKNKTHKPYLILQFLVLGINEHQIDEVLQWRKKKGIDEVQLKHAQIYDHLNGNTLMPSKERFSRYRKREDGTYEIKSHHGDYCRRLWVSSVLTWDGLVVPCCYDKDAENKFGDLSKQSFKEIWLGSKRKKFIRKVFTDRSDIKICMNCGEGIKMQG